MGKIVCQIYGCMSENLVQVRECEGRNFRDRLDKYVAV